jgi:predicted anti-sigma-YlaC factor YlaD
VSENEIVFASRLLVLPGLFILGGFAVMVATVIRNGKVAELRHRERMAMIERGLTPPEPVLGAAGSPQASSSRMTTGIVLCGLGAALFMLIAFAGGQVGIGTGVGGAFAAVGAAFMASAMGAKRDSAPPS